MESATATMSSNRIPENGALARRTAGEISVFDRIDKPLEFVDQMGKWLYQGGIGGAQSEAQGKCLAFACLCKKMDPFDIVQRFHIIDGKLSKKADTILADFNAAGGIHKWVKTGDDGQCAALQLTIDGESIISEYSIHDAAADNLIERKGSRWAKGGRAAGEMMRARCISRGVRMLRPGIVAGMYTPEEIEDERPVAVAAASAMTADELGTRRREILGAVADVGQLTADPNLKDASVVDAEYSTTKDGVTTTVGNNQTTVTEEKPALLSADDLQLGATIDEIVVVARKLGHAKREDFEAGLRAGNPSFKTLNDLTLPAAEKLLANLKKAADAGK